MVHHMKLKPAPFYQMRKGAKTIELRLYEPFQLFICKEKTKSMIKANHVANELHGWLFIFGDFEDSALEMTRR